MGSQKPPPKEENLPAAASTPTPTRTRLPGKFILTFSSADDVTSVPPPVPFSPIQFGTYVGPEMHHDSTGYDMGGETHHSTNNNNNADARRVAGQTPSSTNAHIPIGQNHLPQITSDQHRLPFYGNMSPGGFARARRGQVTKPLAPIGSGRNKFSGRFGISQADLLELGTQQRGHYQQAPNVWHPMSFSSGIIPQASNIIHGAPAVDRIELGSSLPGWSVPCRPSSAPPVIQQGTVGQSLQPSGSGYQCRLKCEKNKHGLPCHHVFDDQYRP